MKNTKVQIIDDTLREGMQYRGLMFSREQRLKILDFQEQLGVDICRAGYPPAHEHEAAIVKTLADHARNNQFQIQVAAMGRARADDADLLLHSGAAQLHLHANLGLGKDKAKQINDLLELISSIHLKTPETAICIILMDIGKTQKQQLETTISAFKYQPVKFIGLADTTGTLSPNQVFDSITSLVKTTNSPPLSIHCHNDMGMAAANTLMGVVAGSSFFEACVLGIGERNGIADLFTTAKSLKNQGFDINLKTEDIDTFKAYYEYVDAIVYEQQKDHLIRPNTPFFGQAITTHVAGTHANDKYGKPGTEYIFINSLCGKHLVKRFLNHHHLDCPQELLPELTLKIKAESIQLNRCLTPMDVQKILNSFS